MPGHPVAADARERFDKLVARTYVRSPGRGFANPGIVRAVKPPTGEAFNSPLVPLALAPTRGFGRLTRSFAWGSADALTIQDWGAIGEIVGAVGIVVTLIYLAREGIDEQR